MSKPAITAGSLVDVLPPARPGRNACRDAAAEALADDVVKWLEETDGKQDRAEIVKQLIAVSPHHWSDGYAFAKALGDSGWSPNAELVEILDSAQHLLTTAEDRAHEAWVREHQVRLTLADGAMVEAEIGGKRRRGKVVRLYPALAKYVVNVPEDMPETGGYIVAGEKVWPHDQQASAA